MQTHCSCCLCSNLHCTHFLLLLHLSCWKMNFWYPPTSFCSLAIPLIFSFSIIVLVCSDVWYAGFVDLIPSLSLAPRRILAFWKKSSILIMCFFLLVYSADDGIFLLFWGELLFRSKLDSLWLFLIFTLLSVCCLIGFLLPFLQFAVTGSIESIFFTSEMTSFVVNRFGDLCPISLIDCLRCSIILVIFGHLERLFQLLCVKNIFSLHYILGTFCPFFSVDNCWYLMLLTKHVIRLNHYHCWNPPLYCNIV